ncbi:hypothetical protein GMRT_15337 [Giardia muris]|uniref:Uncharacterized protein n=1 Tax=Giardia muris TaxID=5742 RepID=A0A4Z1SZN8_GIAMU|nr:hypothetical protein GMRT_15337 [Giardia muris]|eukprot:TNJ28918.1 hypothetical protein GMRT_15337 [Giardia muris]
MGLPGFQSLLTRLRLCTPLTPEVIEELRGGIIYVDCMNILLSETLIPSMSLEEAMGVSFSKLYECILRFFRRFLDLGCELVFVREFVDDVYTNLDDPLFQTRIERRLRSPERVEGCRVCLQKTGSIKTYYLRNAAFGCLSTSINAALIRMARTHDKVRFVCAPCGTDADTFIIKRVLAQPTKNYIMSHDSDFALVKGVTIVRSDQWANHTSTITGPLDLDGLEYPGIQMINNRSLVLELFGPKGDATPLVLLSVLGGNDRSAPYLESISHIYKDLIFQNKSPKYTSFYHTSELPKLQVRSGINEKTYRSSCTKTLEARDRLLVILYFIRSIKAVSDFEYLTLFLTFFKDIISSPKVQAHITTTIKDIERFRTCFLGTLEDLGYDDARCYDNVKSLMKLELPSEALVQHDPLGLLRRLVSFESQHNVRARLVLDFVKKYNDLVENLSLTANKLLVPEPGYYEVALPYPNVAMVVHPLFCLKCTYIFQEDMPRTFIMAALRVVPDAPLSSEYPHAFLYELTHVKVPIHYPSNCINQWPGYQVTGYLWLDMGPACVKSSEVDSELGKLLDRYGLVLYGQLSIPRTLVSGPIWSLTSEPALRRAILPFLECLCTYRVEVEKLRLFLAVAHSKELEDFVLVCADMMTSLQVVRDTPPAFIQVAEPILAILAALTFSLSCQRYQATLRKYPIGCAQEDPLLLESLPKALLCGCLLSYLDYLTASRKEAATPASLDGPTFDCCYYLGILTHKFLSALECCCILRYVPTDQLTSKLGSFEALYLVVCHTSKPSASASDITELLRLYSLDPSQIDATRRLLDLALNCIDCG